jgi:hypothetical protein
MYYKHNRFTDPVLLARSEHYEACFRTYLCGCDIDKSLAIFSSELAEFT